MIPPRAAQPSKPFRSSALALALAVSACGGRQTAPQPPATPATAPQTLPNRGNTEDRLLARLRERAPLFALDVNGGCAAISFIPTSDDGAQGEVSFGATSLEYWIEAGALALKRSEGVFAERRALRGWTEASLLVGESELFFTQGECERHARRSPPWIIAAPTRPSPERDRFAQLLHDESQAVVLYLDNGNKLELQRQPGEGPARALLSWPAGAPEGIEAIFYPEASVAWLSGRGLYDLSLEHRGFVLGGMRVRYDAGDAGDAGDAASPSLPRPRFPALQEVPAAFEPARELFERSPTLYWPTLTARGVECQAQRLEGERGSLDLRSGQEHHVHRYIQNRFGIQLIPERGYAYYPAPGAKQHVFAMALPARSLAVHGRDDVSYFVDGSRWFLAEEDCERHKTRVRPLELEFVRRLTPFLASQPAFTPARRPIFPFQPGSHQYRRITNGECEVVTLQAHPVNQFGSPARGRLHTLNQASDYDYELYFDPPAIWLSPRAPHAERLSGELLSIGPSAEQQGTRVGDTIWHDSLAACQTTADR